MIVPSRNGSSVPHGGAAFLFCQKRRPAPAGAVSTGDAPFLTAPKRKPSRGASLAPAGQFTFCAAPGGREKAPARGFRRAAGVFRAGADEIGGVSCRRAPVFGNRKRPCPRARSVRKRGWLRKGRSVSYRCRYPEKSIGLSVKIGQEISFGDVQNFAETD